MKGPDLLRHFNGNITLAAESLRVSRPTIYKWIALDTLPDVAMMHMRDWFIRDRGDVPKVWMPKVAA